MPSMSSAADSAINNAIQKAYAEGFAAGLAEGKRIGGGTTGIREPRIVIGPKGGGTTGMARDLLLASKSASKPSQWELSVNSEEKSVEGVMQEIRSRLTKDQSETGTVVIEGMPLNELTTLSDALRKSGASEIRIAPKAEHGEKVLK